MEMNEKKADNFKIVTQKVYRSAPWLFVTAKDVFYRIVPEPWATRLVCYGLLMRIDKPIGTLLLMWPTLWALWLANEGPPDLHILVVFLLGTFLMRSAGCVINDFADRDFDGSVARTKHRPLAQRKVSPFQAMILFCVLALSALALVLTLNVYTIALSFGAIFIASAYPFMKRYTYFPQVVLGAAFAWSIPMAFAASTNSITVEAWLLYVSTLMWVLAYDTFYGMVDRKDDLKIGIKSTAILFGDADLAIISVIQGFFMFGMLLLGARYDMASPYYMSWFVAAGFIAYQVWIARKRKPEKCFKAFLNNNYVGLVLFLGIAINYAYF
ncbi:4-hydroxybenzoate octaprenyltransferase [Pleionea sediminis]|uniref:4-hydroxybenzoate octaprenyltransferase n=1 Tax=Pleionea sediminis TaxID=2569479 RepID=UPI001FE8FD39|nr:4-hydroxybenzoate octaprenyltransferase [Pleionea sediminis]